MVKNPVDSTTMSTPSSFQGKSSGSLFAKIRITFPFTLNPFSVTSIFAEFIPWIESYLNKWARVLGSVKSFIATISNKEEQPISFKTHLRTFLPILPNPFIATFTNMNNFPP